MVSVAEVVVLSEPDVPSVGVLPSDVLPQAARDASIEHRMIREIVRFIYTYPFKI